MPIPYVAKPYRDRLAKFAVALERYGVAKPHCHAVAAGILQTLREWCWAALTDILGTSADVDRIAAFPMPAPLCLARLLVMSGLAGVSKGLYFLPSAYTESPRYIQARWIREAYPAMVAARRRSQLPSATLGESILKPPSKKRLKERDLQGLLLLPDMTPGMLEPPVDEQPLEHRGRPPLPDVRKGHEHTGTPGYKDVVVYWFTEWTARVGHGLKPAFRGEDGRHIKDIIEASGDADQARRIIDAYLTYRGESQWYAGKPLRKLIADINKFIALAASRPAADGQELPCLDGDGAAGGSEAMAGDGGGGGGPAREEEAGRVNQA